MGDKTKDWPWQQFAPVRPAPLVSVNDRVAAATGLPHDVVERVLLAQLAFQFALGIAHPDDDGVGPKLRKKYSELLRESVTNTSGRSPERPVSVSYELEATIVQLESGEPARHVVAVIAAYTDILGPEDSQASANYRDWATRWLE